MKIIKTYENYIEDLSPYTPIKDILPKDILSKIKNHFGIKQLKRLGSGLYGTAYKISPDKVLKITRDMSEYVYAKRLVGKENKHISNIYSSNYITYNGTQYGIIIKEFCRTNDIYFETVIDNIDSKGQNNISLGEIGYKFLLGDISEVDLSHYFNQVSGSDNHEGWFAAVKQFYEMFKELKSHDIVILDFKADNFARNKINNYCIIETGYGWWDNLTIDSDGELLI